MRCCLCQVLLLLPLVAFAPHSESKDNRVKGKCPAERTAAPDPSATTTGTSGGDRRLQRALYEYYRLRISTLEAGDGKFEVAAAKIGEVLGFQNKNGVK